MEHHIFNKDHSTEETNVHYQRERIDREYDSTGVCNEQVESVSTSELTVPLIIKEMFSWIIKLVAIFIVAFLIVSYIGQRTEVSGSSMEPTLHNGDNLIIDKISYRLREPKRFEIIVLKYQHQRDTHYIKRIVGLPGEKIQIINGFVYINGKLLVEDVYGSDMMQYAGIAQEQIELGKDEYFVLGDNRNGSTDSRDSKVGIVKKSIVEGRAWIRIYPFDSFGSVNK